MKLPKEYRAPDEAGGAAIEVQTNGHGLQGKYSTDGDYDEYAELPEAMRQARRWMVWRSEDNRKVPYYVSGRRRNGTLDTETDMAQFGTFEQAIAVVGRFDGLAFALGPDGTGDYWQGVDLDDVAEHGLHSVVDDLPGYTEQSPSGTGWHAVGYGRRFDNLGSNKTGVEAYSTARFFTVTGDCAGLHDPECLADFVASRIVPIHRKCEKSHESGIQDAQRTVSDETIADLRSALNAINADDRDPWIRIGHALHELGDVGRGLWFDWSQTSDKWKPGDAKQWATFKPASGIGIETVFYEAKSRGWLNPRSNAANVPTKSKTPAPAPADDLAQFDITGDIDAMRQKMLDEMHVLGNIALLGQFTVLYAPPNAGKTLLTLWLLRESIQDGNIDGERVFYVNCDDSFRGLIDKGEFARGVGFRMLGDGMRGFKSGDLLAILARMIEGGNAHGAVVILDTFKKFTDLMDKPKQGEINKTLRAFVQAGGTLIALAHVNKHRDADGKHVYGGTTDARDDADCAYIMDTSGADDECIVTFDNIKMRGDVARQARYQYDSSEGVAWLDRLESVREASDDDARRITKREERERAASDNPEIVTAATQALSNGDLNQRDLVKFVSGETGIGRDKIRRTVKALTGTDYFEGHKWERKTGENNASFYRLIPHPAAGLLDKHPAHPQTRKTRKPNGQNYEEMSNGW